MSIKVKIEAGAEQPNGGEKEDDHEGQEHFALVRDEIVVIRVRRWRRVSFVVGYVSPGKSITKDKISFVCVR